MESRLSISTSGNSPRSSVAIYEPVAAMLVSEGVVCGEDANMMGEYGGASGHRELVEGTCNEGRSVENDFDRCTSWTCNDDDEPLCTNVKLLLKAFFAEADTVCIFVEDGDPEYGDLEEISGDSATSLSRGEPSAAESCASTADATGTSPSTRLSLRALRISFIFSSVASSFVVGGTGSS